MEQMSEWFSFGEGAHLPQEKMVELAHKSHPLVLGLPVEFESDERRIALTPQAVNVFVNQGVVVLKEREAGSKANYSDADYAEAGATICASKEDVYKCDVLLKIGAVTEQELPFIHDKQIIFSTISFQKLTKSILSAFARKHVTAVGYEFVHDGNEYYPILHSMNEISGTLSVLVAAECLTNNEVGKSVLLGGVTGISPAEVVIFGANTAGEFAARAALGLGSEVKLFDSCMQRLTSVQQVLSQRLFTSNYHEKVLRKALLSADVVIGAICLESNDQYMVVEDMVKSMKRGAVIVDLCMNQGGCFETSKPTTFENPTFVKHKVVHYCVPNLASKAARTASIALSNILMPMVQNVLNSGAFYTFLKQNLYARRGVYMYNGIITNESVARMYGLNSKSIDLLLAAF